MPFRIELCTFSIVMKLGSKDGFDILFICSQDQSVSYDPDLTRKGVDCRLVCKHSIPSCKQIVFALVMHGSSYEAESKWHPGVDSFSMSSQRSDSALLLNS